LADLSSMSLLHSCCCALRLARCFFFFTDPATTVIYTLSLHDALPIYLEIRQANWQAAQQWTARALKKDAENATAVATLLRLTEADRKSTRLNSSHVKISYAVFCLKKKNSNEPTWHCAGALHQARRKQR